MSTPTWDVVQFADGSLVLVDHGAEVPVGGTVVAETANPYYIEDSAPKVPHVVTRRQMFHALDQAGLLDGIEAFVAGQTRAVQIDWNESREFRRDNLLLNQMAPLLGLSSEDLDALFIAADAVV